MSEKRIEIVNQAGRSAAEAEEEPAVPPYDGPAFLSYGFRPFFLSAALFGGVAVPAWVVIFAGVSGSNFLYAPREWHVHEMLFGFLPAVMTGFLLTAIPNWTGRVPLRGTALMSLWLLWLAGRLLLAWPWFGVRSTRVCRRRRSVSRYAGNVRLARDCHGRKPESGADRHRDQPLRRCQYSLPCVGAAVRRPICPSV